MGICIGKKLKDIRMEKGLSLDEASSITGVSKAMLSQIERDESTPTLATLWKIANGLKVRMTNLLDSESGQNEIVSISHLTPTTENGEKILIYCLFPFSPTSGFEYYYGVFKPGCLHAVEGHNVKTEYLIVSYGEIDLRVEEESYHLTAGSAISFDATKKHSYANNGTGDAILSFVLSS